MNVLKGIEPERVFYYFNEISKIPHGSGNTKKISDFCVDFAIKQGLSYSQDEKNNVIIKKKKQGTLSDNTVIIQGHLDMVCEKEDGLPFDFENDCLNLQVDDDFIFAKGTTLGADDGIAIAYALAILESKDIVHPDIEAVFTVDEEIGLLGASFIDLSDLKGNLLLNIDSEEEGIFTVSCAGGATVKCSLPLEYEKASGTKYLVKIHNLKGGHSGVEIDKQRANSNILASRILFSLITDYKINLVDIKGGLKDNAIPPLTEFSFYCDENVDNIIDLHFSDFKKEFKVADPDIMIEYEKVNDTSLALTKDSTFKAVNMLMALPNGIISMDMEIKGLVKTSLNMGILRIFKERLEASYSVRSSSKSEKKALIDKITSVANLSGASIEISGEYSPWEYKSESYLRDAIKKAYNNLYNKEPEFKAIHAGLECGVLGEKIKNLDAISFGPDIFDIHTPKERLSISSTKRTWEFIKEVLKNL